MPRYALLVLVLLVSACDPGPQAGTRLMTIDSPEAGLSLQELPSATLKTLGLPFGLAVVKAGGLAERSGLKMGDVIYGINQQKAESLEQFNRLLAQHDGGKLGFLVRRGEIGRASCRERVEGWEVAGELRENRTWGG